MGINYFSYQPSAKVSSDGGPKKLYFGKRFNILNSKEIYQKKICSILLGINYFSNQIKITFSAKVYSDGGLYFNNKFNTSKFSYQLKKTFAYFWGELFSL